MYEMKIFGKYCVQILFAHNFVQRCYRQVETTGRRLSA